MKADPSFVFDDSRYARLAIKCREQYGNADPFPHIVLDDFLPDAMARALAADFPEPDSKKTWVECKHENATKHYQHDETKLPPLIRKMLREFNSRNFVLFIETLTGIPNLIPDPYFTGGGAHSSSGGDFLKIHADFNWHDKLLLHRRVNALFYLNEDWREEWGGHLELWDSEMTSAVQHISPDLNRLVVFSTSEHSHHGHPHPLQSPTGVNRKTLNLYYYTRFWDDREMSEPHFTQYKSQSSFAIELGQNYGALGEQDSDD
ncbi:MAG: 2OG-Fe(II) oxygenase [Proteobacteria bacterium]|nr:2OG-Fe(II) oxygenase [Pseudomonadota bacterium]